MSSRRAAPTPPSVPDPPRPAPGVAIGDERGRWNDPAFEALAVRVWEVAGLVFPQNRISFAESSLKRLIDRLGLSGPKALVDAFDSDSTVREHVLAELTIGETYFFRDPRQFDVVRDTILPALRERRNATRRLRLWSAGCASGEEAYSLVMLLRETGWPHPASILGTDIAAPRLAAARRGRYAKWALRGVPEHAIERWFSAQSGARLQFVLDPSIRREAEFRLLNLVSDEYPSTASGVFAMDVVFCRNVLIYFDVETVRRVAERLLASLSDDGWLLLGASDPPLMDLVDCEVVTTGAGLAYRAMRGARRGSVKHPSVLVRPPGSASPLSTRSVTAVSPASERRIDGRDAEPGEWTSNDGRATDPPNARATVETTTDAATSIAGTPVPTTTTADAAAAYRVADYDRALSIAAAVLDGRRETDGDPALWLVRVRSLANLGRLADAGAACAAALDRHPLSAELLYMQGVLLAAGGRARDAAAAARRAIYLDRHFVPAHMLLGEQLARLGEREPAVRAFDNAERLLVPLAPDVVVAGTDDAPAIRLLHVVRSRRAALTASAGNAA